MKLGYIRVSRDKQTTALQEDAMRQEQCERTFTDKMTGKRFDRPEFLRMLDLARTGDVIIVWRLDRLGRSLKDLIETVQALEKRGIELRSLKENIDTTTPTGKLMFHLFLLVIVHFPQKSRIDAWIPSVLNIQKQPQRIMSRVKERRLSFHIGEA